MGIRGSYVRGVARRYFEAVLGYSLPPIRPDNRGDYDCRGHLNESLGYVIPSDMLHLLRPFTVD